jgi:ankyrin repeat protein
MSKAVVLLSWPVLLLTFLLGGIETGNCFAPGDVTDHALLDAIRSGELPRIKDLLDKGARATTASEDGTTALMHATLLCNTETMRLLLDRGADVNSSNKDGATALMWAVGDLEKAKLLVDRGANVNAKAATGHTPLLMAAGCADSLAVVKVLLDKGADAKVASRGYTPLMAGAGNREVVRLLITKGVDVKAANTVGWTALHAAAFCGETGAVKDLLDHGASVASRENLQGRTPLIWAAARASSEVVKLLLDHGADACDKESFNGSTALIWASASDKGNRETIDVLLSKGADPSAKDRNGDTALSWAARHGDKAILEVLRRTDKSSDDSPQPKPAGKQMGDDNTVARAVAASLPLLVKSNLTFFAKSTERCISCHHQSLPAIVFAAAEDRGFAVDRKASRELVDETLRIMSPRRERILQGMGVPDQLDPGYLLWGLAAAGKGRDDVTDALVHYLTNHQERDGRWETTFFRPPMNDSPFTATAVSLLALKKFAPKGRAEEMSRRVSRARDWLLSASARTTEDKTFRLLGLVWAGARRADIDRAVEVLLKEQRPDGGWAQRSSMASDAYATGQVLFALHQSGVASLHQKSFRRGIRYLLDTQLQDGSWFVESRSLPIQPYFETGFPHGRSQFISCAATSWATLALILSSGEQQSSRKSHHPTKVDASMPENNAKMLGRGDP